jgi:hypothetical protein
MTFARITLATLSVLACPSLDAATFVVTNSNDDGPGSLRAAINAADAAEGPDRIEFAIPGNGPHAIFARSSFVIETPIEIDGYTQPGSRANDAADPDTTNADIRIVIDATHMPGGYNVGMQVPGDQSTIRGLAFVRGAFGMIVRGHENVIEGNFFGYEPDGVTPAALQTGVQIYGEFNQLGGTEAARRNLFGGYDTALSLAPGAIRNVVRGNIIGANRHGVPGLGQSYGIVTYEARLNRIGDYGPDGGNLIVGHSVYGVGIMHGEGNAVVGNRIHGNAKALINNRFYNDPPCAPDDALDADEGSNHCMNRPVIESAEVVAPGRLRVRGRLHSEPMQSFRIALYGHGDTCAATQGGEGDRYLGYIDDVLTDADGNAAFVFDGWAFDGAAPRQVAAIAGREVVFVDSTSEYSACVRVGPDDRLFMSDFEQPGQESQAGGRP